MACFLGFVIPEEGVSLMHGRRMASAWSGTHDRLHPMLCKGPRTPDDRGGGVVWGGQQFTVSREIPVKSKSSHSAKTVR